jgi:hypothetical protein
MKDTVLPAKSGQDGVFCSRWSSPTLHWLHQNVAGYVAIYRQHGLANFQDQGWLSLRQTYQTARHQPKSAEPVETAQFGAAQFRNVCPLTGRKVVEGHRHSVNFSAGLAGFGPCGHRRCNSRAAEDWLSFTIW